MGRVTLSTIARETGLSKFAVSRSLSGKSGVSEATRKRVSEIAKSLGYERPEPNITLKQVALVFQDTDLVNSEFNLLVQNGVQMAAQELGYQIAVRWTHVPDEVEAIAKASRGVIMIGPHDKESLERAYSVGKPIVRNRWLEPLEHSDQVSGTDHEAGSAVGHYLVSLGHRSIAYVHGTPGYRGRIERYHGIRVALEQYDGITFREMVFSATKGFPECLAELKAEGIRPTAFFCAHDGLAVNVVSEMLRLGCRIPTDISVVGHGDYSSATQITPHLTTVRPHGRVLGASCLRLIDDRIHERIDPAYSIRLQIASTMVKRQSSGPAPSGDNQSD